MLVCQKLGMVLICNKEVQKLTLEKNIFVKKRCPKVIFTIDFFLISQRFLQSLTSKIDFESLILALFDELYFNDRFVIFYPLSMLILGQKSCFLEPTIFYNRTDILYNHGTITYSRILLEGKPQSQSYLLQQRSFQ